jgi:WhiB family transcriptional regulator, redox-sensing transcriptional regulator
MRVPPPGWRARTACANADHDLFVGELDFDQETRAKAICEECQVRDACLAFSITHGIQYGIWGGFNASERQRIRQIWSQQRASGVAGRRQQTA